MNKLVKTISFCCIAIFLLTACSKEVKEQTLTGATMGTTYHIKYFSSDVNTPAPEKLSQEIDNSLVELNNKMSTFIPDSELSKFNQLKANVSVKFSQELEFVVKEAIRINELTLGAEDITVGPLVNLWGFGPIVKSDTVPTQAQIDETMQLTGHDKLIYKNNLWSKAKDGVYIDLSSIAKGYGVDKVSRLLEKNHITNYMVEIGGELRVRGQKADGKSWKIAIEQPDYNQRTVEKVVSLKDVALATSGDYRNYFENNGVRYSHEIDPKTGRPVQHKLASISVFTPSCMTSDGLATGLFVLGEEKALEIATKNNIAIVMIVRSKDKFQVIASPAGKKYLGD